MWQPTLILNFHGIGTPIRTLEPGESRYWVARDVFEGVLDEVMARRRAGTRFAITFDDGNVSDWDIAAPALKARGLSATFFVLAGRIGVPGFLSEQQIHALAADGMTIGSHGCDHLRWTEISDAALSRELYHARDVVEQASGTTVNHLAVPFGLFDRRVVRAARRAGYRRIMTSSGGLAVATSGLVPRLSIRSDFNPHRDLDTLLSGRNRMISPLRDGLRRLKYRL